MALTLEIHYRANSGSVRFIYLLGCIKFDQKYLFVLNWSKVFIYLGCIKLIKSDSKTFTNVTYIVFQINAFFFYFLKLFILLFPQKY